MIFLEKKIRKMYSIVVVDPLKYFERGGLLNFLYRSHKSQRSCERFSCGRPDVKISWGTILNRAEGGYGFV